MARLAPTCTVAHAVVVVHLFCAPGRGTAVARFAIHCRAIEQLRFRNMIAGFRQRAPIVALRGVAATVTRLAGGGADHRVVHGHGGIETDL